MLTQAVQQRRKLLLNLKCLFWCLNQMQTRYDLNLVLYSLEHMLIHPEVRDSNLGDNLAYLIEHLPPEDLARVAGAMEHLPESEGQVELGDKSFCLGHYIQALTDFGPIAEGSYGIIATVTPKLRGLFLVDGERLHESQFEPDQVRVIFGTYIV